MCLNIPHNSTVSYSAARACADVSFSGAQETSIAKALLRGDFGEEDVVSASPVLAQ
jgi:hypothetical protein